MNKKKRKHDKKEKTNILISMRWKTNKNRRENKERR